MGRRAALLTALVALVPAARADAIIGGEPAPEGAYPAVGVLHSPLQPPSLLRCTGTLVAPQWVLTAGHCFQLVGPVFTLDPATADGSGGTTYEIDRTVPAPEFAGAYNGDAALYHLTTPADIAPMQVAGPMERGLWRPQSAGLLLGFGAESQELAVPAGLKRTAATVLPDPDCEAAYSPGELRAARSDRDLCVSLGEAVGGPGDSGGPLLVTAPDGRVRIAGVTSGYQDPNLGGDPLLVARVAGDFMRPWLEELAPEALGTPTRLSVKRLRRGRLELLVTGSDVRSVRFAVSGRRARLDRRAPFRRVVRSRTARVRAKVSRTYGEGVTLRRRLAR